MHIQRCVDAVLERVGGRPGDLGRAVEAGDAELDQAQPLSGNEFKVELTRGAIVATLAALTNGAQR
ncbi:hypothetical protein [Mycobacterium sp. E136]|uniref:hypothetical protein n=1 Tax=Mycobacterium sp. E136 TaxID=1834125 RepID=UPI000B118A83|nr:hypothetical protein [Mycobacterium sp. E136]